MMTILMRGLPSQSALKLAPVTSRYFPAAVITLLNRRSLCCNNRPYQGLALHKCPEAAPVGVLHVGYRPSLQ